MATREMAKVGYQWERTSGSPVVEVFSVWSDGSDLMAMDPDSGAWCPMTSHGYYTTRSDAVEASTP